MWDRVLWVLLQSEIQVKLVYLYWVNKLVTFVLFIVFFFYSSSSSSRTLSSKNVLQLSLSVSLFSLSKEPMHSLLSWFCQWNLCPLPITYLYLRNYTTHMSHDLIAYKLKKKKKSQTTLKFAGKNIKKMKNKKFT